MNTFDLTVFHAINGLAGRYPLLDGLGVALTVFAPELFGAMFLVLWVIPSAERPHRRRAIVYALAAGVLALIINAVIASAFDRLRPFAVLPDVHLLVDHDPRASFPSDHASGSFALAATMVQGGRQIGWGFWVFSALVGLSRLYVGVHWPTDILGSIAVGLLSAILVSRVSTT